MGRGSVGSSWALSLTGGPPSYNPSLRDVAARHRYAAFGSYPCDFRSGADASASIPVFSQSRVGRPPPPPPSVGLSKFPASPFRVFRGVMPPVGSVEDFPPFPFFPDPADWEESESLLSDPLEDLAYATNSASKLAYLAREAESLLTQYMGDLYAPISDITPPGESSSAHSSFFAEHNIPKSGIALPPDFIHEYERVSKAPRNQYRMALITSVLFSRIPRSTSIRKGLPRSCLLSGLRSPLRTRLPLHRIVRKTENGNLFRNPHFFQQDWRSSKPHWLICYLERTIWGSHQRIAPWYMLCFLASLSRASVKLLALCFSRSITVASWPFPHWGYRRVSIVLRLRLYPWKAHTFSQDKS